MREGGARIERYVVVARLKPGEAAAAEQLLLEGPPFDPGEAGFSAHEAYLGEDRVYLVFEAKPLEAKPWTWRAGTCRKRRAGRRSSAAYPRGRRTFSGMPAVSTDGRLRASRRRSLGSR